MIVHFCSPTTHGVHMLRVTVTCSETDEKNATFKVVTKVIEDIVRTVILIYWGLKIILDNYCSFGVIRRICL